MAFTKRNKEVSVLLLQKKEIVNSAANQRTVFAIERCLHTGYLRRVILYTVQLEV